MELPKRHDPAHELEDRAVPDWCQFLDATSDEELESLAMTDPNFERAKQALEDLSADPKARELARDREVWHFFHDQELYLTRKAGRAEGRAEGIVEGRAEGLLSAIRALCEVLDIDVTAAREARLADASDVELEALLAGLKTHRRWPESP